MGYVRRRSLRFFCLVVATLALTAPVALADDPPPGSTWSEAYIDEPDGTRLHADILRPASLPKDAKTPVILSIGPYFNHSGQVGPAGPLEDTPYNPQGNAGPSSRFFDFVAGARLMERGYTYVMVDLRGFGGSSGCLDWAGPGEQADIKAAVQWAATQPWSTGKVGMYGKSYDAVTGLFGAALRPQGLAAVVAQEPVYDMYRYLYANGVRYQNSLLTPALYDAIAETPGAAGDSGQYQQNATDDSARPGCPLQNWADQAGNPDPSTGYWRQRDLIQLAKGTTIPVFMTQGFLEDNTKPDGTWDFFDDSLAGPKRAWFGMWDHVRGNQTDPATGRLEEGRAGFFDEVMRFYDEYLKGIQPSVQDPPIAVQTSDGSWRAESQWPPADARGYASALEPGAYTDNGLNNGTQQGFPENGDGIWTFSPATGYDVHLAGIPKATLDVETQAPAANLVVDVYDVDPSNNATLISRNTMLVNQSGRVALDLYGDDWIIRRHHRVGVLVTGSNSEWWAHVPTGQDVTVKSASITLPFLTCARTQTIEGDPSVKLESYLKNAPFQVDATTVEDQTAPAFSLPAPAANCSQKALGAKAKSKPRHRATRHKRERHLKRRHR